MPKPYRTLFWTLLAANAVLAAFWFVAPSLANGTTSAGLRTPRAATPANSQPSSPASGLADLRHRLTERLEAACLARAEQSALSTDPMVVKILRLSHNAVADRITTDYAELLHDLDLSPETKRELQELLTRREIPVKIFTQLPPDALAAGIPATYEFGRDFWDTRIRERFGADLFAKVAAYESEIPLLKETADLVTALAVAQQDLPANQRADLQDLLRRFPSPAKTDQETKADFAARRLERIEQVITAADSKLGTSTAEALADYLFAGEARHASTDSAIEMISALRRARASQAAKPTR